MNVGNPLDSLGEEVNELVGSFKSQAIFGSLDAAGFTQYSFWFAVAVVLMLILLFAFKKRQLLGESWKRHFPFIASIFLVVLANNIVGIIPGCKPGTGTISTTAALAVCSFVYFIVCGVKKHGALGYAKSLAPAGVAFPLNALVWLIEVFSTILRLITLAVRLFCNLFAGHVVMGTFAILASLFFEPMIQAFSAATALQAGASVLWVGILLVIYVVEIMVAAIQAYVFALLSAVYIQIAESDEE